MVPAKPCTSGSAPGGASTITKRLVSSAYYAFSDYGEKPFGVTEETVFPGSAILSLGKNDGRRRCTMEMFHPVSYTHLSSVFLTAATGNEGFRPRPGASANPGSRALTKRRHQ